MPIRPNKSIVNDSFSVDKGISEVILADMNKYVLQALALGLTPIQALSALEQLEATAKGADRELIVEAISYFTTLAPEMV